MSTRRSEGGPSWSVSGPGTSAAVPRHAILIRSAGIPRSRIHSRARSARDRASASGSTSFRPETRLGVVAAKPVISIRPAPISSV